MIAALAMAATQLEADSPKPFVAVPIEMTTGLPVLRATVSGQPVLLIVDLGGYKGIALTPEALKKLSVNYDSRVESWRNSAGEVFHAKLFSASDVKIGEQSVGSVDGIEYATTIPGVDGYIGFAVLKNFTLVFDYPHNELRIYPPTSAALASECGAKNPVHLEIVNGVVQSKIDTDKGQLVFQWDTGASENVLRPSAIDLSGDTPVPSHVFSRFEIGGKSYGRTRIPLREFIAPNVDGVLGSEFFASRIVCLDFKSRSAAIR